MNASLKVLTIPQNSMKYNTPRKSIAKMHDITRKNLIKFIERTNGYIDITRLKSSIKIDGQAFRIAVTPSSVEFESSYSGLQSDPNFFTNERLRRAFSIIDNIKEWLMFVSSKLRVTFKLVGEVICPLDSEGDYFTPVVTKYSRKKVGLAKFIILKTLDEEGREMSPHMHRKVYYAIRAFNQFMNNGVSAKIASEIFRDGRVFPVRHSSSIIKYELVNDFMKEWKEQRSIIVDKFDSVKIRTPYSSKDSISEGFVFDVPELGTFAHTFTEWRRKHRELLNATNIVD